MPKEFNFNQMVSHAKTIINSGRYDELSNLSVELHKVTNEKDEWLATVFTSLHYRNGLEFKKLEYSLNMKGDVLADIAWHTRNLVELCVLITYCCKSKENAHIFYSDAARDGHDLLSSMKEWSLTTGLFPEDEKFYRNAIDHLNRSATSKNVSNIDKPYQRIHKIAKSVKLDHHFLTLNKMLSKYIHPTAFSVIGNWDDITTQKQKNIFYEQACVMFVQNFNLLEDAINRLYRTYST